MERAGTNEDQMNNVSRKHTIWFDMAKYGNYYIASRRHALTNFICDWLEGVHEDYILRANLLGRLFQSFSALRCLEVIFENDENGNECNAGKDLWQPRFLDNVYEDPGYGDSSS